MYGVDGVRVCKMLRRGSTINHMRGLAVNELDFVLARGPTQVTLCVSTGPEIGFPNRCGNRVSRKLESPN